jgi:chromosome segregation ATPase
MTKAELQKQYNNSKKNYGKLQKAYEDVCYVNVDISNDLAHSQRLYEATEEQLQETEKTCKELSSMEAEAHKQVSALEKEVFALENRTQRMIDHRQWLEQGYTKRGVELNEAYATLKNLIQAQQTGEITSRWRDDE